MLKLKMSIFNAQNLKISTLNAQSLKAQSSKSQLSMLKISTLNVQNLKASVQTGNDYIIAVFAVAIFSSML